MNIFNELCTELFDGDDLQKVKEILNREGKINLNQVSEQYHETPLSLTISGNGEILEIMELLLQNGADPDFPNKNGWLPLECSIDAAVAGEDYHNIEINTKEIELLLKYGADMHKVGGSGKTPYEYSKGYNFDAKQIFEEFMKK